MVTRKRNIFLLYHDLDYATIIKKYPFLISLRYSLCKYLLTSHYVNNQKVSKRYRHQKNMCNLKTFFLRNLSGVLHDLLPHFTAFCYLLNLQKPGFFYFSTSFITSFERDEYDEFSGTTSHGASNKPQKQRFADVLQNRCS